MGWLVRISGAVAGLAMLCNLPTHLWLPGEKATLEYLASTTLQVIGGDRKSFAVSNPVD